MTELDHSKLFNLDPISKKSKLKRWFKSFESKQFNESKTLLINKVQLIGLCFKELQFKIDAIEILMNLHLKFSSQTIF